MNEGLRDWVANVHDTFYIIGTAAGPHPYPELVRDFQSVIGTEARAQMLARIDRLPDLLVAAIGGGSNAIGLFHPFLDDRGREDARRRSGRPRPRQKTRREPCRRLPRRAPRQQDLSAAGRGRPDRRGAFDQRRGSIIPASAPNTPGSRKPAESSYTSASPTPKRSTRSNSCAAPKASSPRSNRATPSPRSSNAHRRWTSRTRSFWQTCADAATRTSSLSRTRSGVADMTLLPSCRDCSGIQRATNRTPLAPAARWAPDHDSGCRMTERSDAAFGKPYPALVAFVTAGDPTPAATPAILDALVVGGADVIELGMPFTDPMADGPGDPGGEPAQPSCRHHHRRHPVRLPEGFRERHPDTPLDADGLRQSDAAAWRRNGSPMLRGQSGVDGVICVDIPPEEDDALGPALRSRR